jgi:hypothetical protein
MSVTNAVSGVVGIGGLHLMGGSYLPDDVPSLLAASAVFMSAVNVFGGFKVWACTFVNRNKARADFYLSAGDW